MTLDATAVAPESGALTLIRLPAVIARTGLSRSALYRLVSIGQFPRSIRLCERSSAWAEHEVTAWIADRIAARDREASR
jgi:prophage regulatory protein